MNWIHQNQVGLTEGVREAYINLDKVAMIKLDNRPDGTKRMILHFTEELFESFEGKRRTMTNVWVVFDTETQDKIKEAINNGQTIVAVKGKE